MAQIQAERTTHEHDESIAVFLIGLRFNKLYRVDQWLPVFLAMPKMITELYTNKALAARGEAEDLGFLEARTLFGDKGVTMVQYWRSAADIYRYASDPEHAHRPAWSAFNQRVRTAAGVVGIWHETYAVPAGGHESLYVGMPVTGLAAATTSAPVAQSNRRHARLERNAPKAG